MPSWSVSSFKQVWTSRSRSTPDNLKNCNQDHQQLSVLQVDLEALRTTSRTVTKIVSITTQAFVRSSSDDQNKFAHPSVMHVSRPAFCTCVAELCRRSSPSRCCDQQSRATSRRCRPEEVSTPVLLSAVVPAQRKMPRPPVRPGSACLRARGLQVNKLLPTNATARSHEQASSQRTCR